MKTIKILTAAAFICVSAISKAQDIPLTDSRNDLQIGLKAGVNLSNIYDMQSQNTAANSELGFVAGGFLSIPFGTYLGFQPEVLFSQKGFSGSGSTLLQGPYSFNQRLNFLDIPLMLQFKPAPNVYLLGGVEYSYLLSRSYTFTQGVTSETTQQEFQNDNITRNVFGVIFGADINFGQLTLGGRLAWDLQDNNGNGTSTLPRYRNFWGQLTLGFRL